MKGCLDAALLGVDEIYVAANRIEAGLWIVIGVAFVIAAGRTTSHRRSFGLLAPVFVAFGISDLVEVHYGQWWDPWWLLVWKGACVLVFLYAFIRYVASRRSVRERGGGDD